MYCIALFSLPQESSHYKKLCTAFCFFECFTAPEYYLRILSQNFAILSLYYMFSCHLELCIIICTCTVLLCLACHENHHTTTRKLCTAFCLVCNTLEFVSAYAFEEALSSPLLAAFVFTLLSTQGRLHNPEYYLRILYILCSESRIFLHLLFVKLQLWIEKVHLDDLDLYLVTFVTSV